MEAPVQVEVDGRLVKTWVTWFVDACHDVILGAAITPRHPNRESVLVALRAAVLQREPYGPAGGLPALVRIDQGKDFLSRTVSEALGAFAVRVVPLPGYTPHLKGTVETINGAAERILFAGLPRYTHCQAQINGALVDPDQPALTFDAFVCEVVTWVRWWNEEHTIAELGDRTPLQSWEADPTPISAADETALWMFTLEDHRTERKITTKGIGFGRDRYYTADWMTGLAGTAVRLRYMPHHDHDIEVFDARTNVHLGTAVLSDQASAETIAAVRRTRARKARQLRADLAAAERARRARYAATTVVAPATRVDTMTTAAAQAELADTRDADLARWSRPDLIAPRAPAPDWILPREPTDADPTPPGL